MFKDRGSCAGGQEGQKYLISGLELSWHVIEHIAYKTSLD